MTGVKADKIFKPQILMVMIDPLGKRRGKNCDENQPDTSTLGSEKSSACGGNAYVTPMTTPSAYSGVVDLNESCEAQTEARLNEFEKAKYCFRQYPDPKQLRNDVYTSLVITAKKICYEYEGYIQASEAWEGYLSGSSSALLSGLATVLTSIETSHALSAASGLVSAIHAQYTSNFFASLAGSVIVPSIEQKQKELEQEFTNKRNLGIDDYNVLEAIADAEDYYNACTLATAKEVATQAVIKQGAVAPPGAPTAVKATPGNAQATVTFTPPASNGGSSITSYTATAYPDGKTATKDSIPITVTGLTNGTSYTFTVTATNPVGTSAPSTPSDSVKPGTPSTPTAVNAKAGNAQAMVTFTLPDPNGSPITSYTVTSSSNGKTTQTDKFDAALPLPLTVTGLTNGKSYTFTVTATNANGTSIASSPSDPPIKLPTQ